MERATSNSGTNPGSDPSGASSQRRLKLVIEYDGTGLSGWQRQDNGPTVQAHLEDALQRMVGAPTRIQGASRTDAGVHARAQVAHFDTDSAIPTYGFRRGLNSHLPPTIAVIGCEQVAPEFHARFSARGKHYRYLVFNRPERSPLYRERAWHRPRPLDIADMARAGELMCGERDFSAFRAAGCSAHTAVRAVREVRVRAIESGVIAIDVTGNAFLRNMVRIMAGTLVAVGVGRVRAADVPEILASGERARAGQTAPAHGLRLMRVFYEREPMISE